jgi:C4-dicarboxylate-specific signal transduction histidine kinase
MQRISNGFRFRLWLSLGAGVVAVALVALLAFEWAQMRSIEQRRGLYFDSVTQLMFQFEREFNKLHTELVRGSAAGASYDYDSLRLRYDIFSSRLTLIHESPNLDMLKGLKEFTATIPNIEKLTSHIDEVLTKSHPNNDDLNNLLLEFERLSADVRNLSQVADYQVSKMVEEQDNTLIDQAKLIVGMTLVQIIAVLAAVIALVLRQRQELADRLQTETDLAQRVEERTAELSQSYLALESTLVDLRAAQAQLIQTEKMASLGQLVASVAHEINTPIGVVKSSGKNIAVALEHSLQWLPRVLDLLHRSDRSLFMALISHSKTSAAMQSTREERALRHDVCRQLDEAGIGQSRHKAAILVELQAHASVQKFLPLLAHPQSEVIFDTASHLASILSNTANINVAVERVAKIIYALKSISRGNNSGEFIEANVKDGIETVLTIYQSQIRQGVELVRKYEEVPALQCLPDELNQVWSNLLHNALQAMNNSGRLTVEIKAHEDNVLVSISDTGCGIPEAIRDRVYEAFFTTKPTGEGSGLGLDIVKKIVAKHSGHIQFNSVEGRGTVFTVYLPFGQKATT